MTDQADKNKKPTRQELRERVKELGITAERAGMPLGTLVITAQQQVDPLSYLALYAPPAPPPTSPPLPEEKPASEEEPAPEEEPTSEENGPAAPHLVTPSPCRLVTVDFPLGGPLQPGAYNSRFIRGQHGHVDTQLSPEQSTTLTRIFKGLDAGGARLKNDRRVASRADVVRWWLEQVADWARKGEYRNHG